MDVQILLGLLIVVLLQTDYTQAASVCKHDTDCQHGQCCYIRPEFEVVSRRRQIQPVRLPAQFAHVHNDTGVCENYRVLAEHCSPFEKLNQHCGCGSGMTCQWVPATTTSGPHGRGLETRRLPYHPGPGAYQCA